MEAKTYSSWFYYKHQSPSRGIIIIALFFILSFVWDIAELLHFLLVWTLILFQKGIPDKAEIFSLILNNFFAMLFVFGGFFVYSIATRLNIIIENNVMHFRKKSFWPFYKGCKASFSWDELSKITIKAEKKSIYSPIIRGFSKRRYEPYLLLEIPGQKIGLYPLEVLSATEEKSFRSIRVHTKERYNTVREEIMDLLDKSEIFFQLKHLCKNAEIVFDEKIYDKRIQKW